MTEQSVAAAAAERAPRQSYDPRELVADVEALLRERGLDPRRVDIETPGARVSAAGMLLRAFDVTPTAGPERALDLDGHLAYNRRVHGD